MKIDEGLVNPWISFIVFISSKYKTNTTIYIHFNVIERESPPYCIVVYNAEAVNSVNYDNIHGLVNSHFLQMNKTNFPFLFSEIIPCSSVLSTNRSDTVGII